MVFSFTRKENAMGEFKGKGSLQEKSASKITKVQKMHC
jgi:hypothetical protein